MSTERILHRCERCGEGYYQPLPEDGVCWVCHDVVARNAEVRVMRRQTSGIRRRHIKFREWSALEGPREYLKATQTVRNFAEHGKSILAVVGKRGTGKTQVGCVAVWQAINAGRSAKIISAMRLYCDLKGRFGDVGDAEGEWLDDWAGLQLLVIDEIGIRIDSDYTRLVLTALLDRRYEDMRPTILIGNVTSEQFARVMGSSVCSRAQEGGGILRFEGWPSFRSEVEK